MFRQLAVIEICCIIICVNLFVRGANLLSKLGERERELIQFEYLTSLKLYISPGYSFCSTSFSPKDIVLICFTNHRQRLIHRITLKIETCFLLFYNNMVMKRVDWAALTFVKRQRPGRLKKLL